MDRASAPVRHGASPLAYTTVKLTFDCMYRRRSVGLFIIESIIVALIVTRVAMPPVSPYTGSVSTDDADLRSLILRETADWPPEAVEALYRAVADMEAPGGWRPFYCPLPLCDGRPHDNWLWAHARWDQHPPADWGDAYILLVLSGRGSGKAVSYATPMPTPLTQSVAGASGWTTMGEVKVGDLLLDESGAPTRVLAVFDVMPEQAYRLHFSDGTYVDACADHLWVTYDHLDRKRLNRGRKRGTEERSFPADWANKAPLTTQQVVDTLRYGPRNDRNHCIPLALPLNLPEQVLPVDPWALGYWLGNGSVKDGSVTTHPGDEQYVRDAYAAVGHPTGPRYSTSGKAPTFTPYGLKVRLDAAGLLHNKHIPATYLRASRFQRERLLAGLLDSDGHYDPEKNTIEYGSKSEVLAHGVAELARTLGQKPVVKKGTSRFNGVEMGPRYRVTWRPSLSHFQSPRKAAGWSPPHGQGSRSYHRMIVAAEPIAPVPMRCVTVDSPNAMYLVGDGMIPTHNTRMGAEWVHRLARHHPGCHIGMLSPTVDAARDVLVEGESGVLSTAHPGFRPEWEPSRRTLTWPNGSTAQTFSADKPERLRGPQHHYLWMDEAASYRNFDETWSNALFGLRLGRAPKAIITTTPKPRKWLRDLEADPQTIVRRVSTYANIANLAETYKNTVIRRYENTALGQQELEGVILDDDFGEALWQDDDFRVADMPVPATELHWHVVGVDPAVTSGGDQTGIVVCAATGERDPARRTAVVLGDHTVTSGGPEVWVRRVIDVYRATPQPCVVVVESNQGGELIGGMIHQIDRTIPISYATAHRSKEVRADPIVLAYRMGRVWHRPGLDALQAQQTEWIPGISKDSPGRIDAVVWALTALLIDPRLLRNYGRVRTMGDVDNVRTLKIKRSPTLDGVDQLRSRQRPGLRPPIRHRKEAQA